MFIGVLLKELTFVSFFARNSWSRLKSLRCVDGDLCVFVLCGFLVDRVLWQVSEESLAGRFKVSVAI